MILNSAVVSACICADPNTAHRTGAVFDRIEVDSLVIQELLSRILAKPATRLGRQASRTVAGPGVSEAAARYAGVARLASHHGPGGTRL